MPTSKPQPDGTLIKALARAWQRQRDEGVYVSVSEIGDAESISKSYVSRILRLALLAPDIVEALDRLSRKLADVADLHDRLTFPESGCTRSTGEMTAVHAAQSEHNVSSINAEIIRCVRDAMDHQMDRQVPLPTIALEQRHELSAENARAPAWHDGSLDKLAVPLWPDVGKALGLSKTQPNGTKVGKPMPMRTFASPIHSIGMDPVHHRQPSRGDEDRSPRGTIRQRGKSTWKLKFEGGLRDPATGKRKI